MKMRLARVNITDVQVTGYNFITHYSSANKSLATITHSIRSGAHNLLLSLSAQKPQHSQLMTGLILHSYMSQIRNRCPWLSHLGPSPLFFPINLGERCSTYFIERRSLEGRLKFTSKLPWHSRGRKHED